MTYSVHSISPTFVLAAAPTPITVTGGYFVGTPLLQCKFGTATVPATLVSNNALQCTPPTALLGAGQTCKWRHCVCEKRQGELVLFCGQPA